MDLSKLIAQATGAAKPKSDLALIAEFVLTPDSMCVCGHPKSAHTDDAGECEILECLSGCTEFTLDASKPPTTVVPINATKPTPPTPIDIKKTPGLTFHIPAGTKTEHSCSAANTTNQQPPVKPNRFDGIDLSQGARGTKPDTALKNHQDPMERTADIPMPKAGTAEAGALRCSKDAEYVLGEQLVGEGGTVTFENCGHLCKCGKWWSHGDRMKCRFPNLVDQGLCPVCLGVGEQRFDSLEDWDKVTERITPEGLVKIANETRKVCANMSIQQLTDHIAFMHRKIEELRTHSMTARKMRADLEEEELNNIPEEEREKFLQALRNGSQKAPRKARAKKDDGAGASTDGVRQSKLEKSIQSIMKSMNLTRQQAEDFIND